MWPSSVAGAGPPCDAPRTARKVAAIPRSLGAREASATSRQRHSRAGLARRTSGARADHAVRRSAGMAAHVVPARGHSLRGRVAAGLLAVACGPRAGRPSRVASRDALCIAGRSEVGGGGTERARQTRRCAPLPSVAPHDPRGIIRRRALWRAGTHACRWRRPVRCEDGHGPCIHLAERNVVVVSAHYSRRDERQRDELARILERPAHSGFRGSAHERSRPLRERRRDLRTGRAVYAARRDGESIRDFDSTNTTCKRSTVPLAEYTRGTMAHEILHTLTLGHDGDHSGALMCAELKNDINEPRRSDITDAQKATLRSVLQPRTDLPISDTCPTRACP